MRLLVFATILYASYDEGKMVFLAPDMLPPNKMDLVLLELNKITSRSSKQKENVKLSSWGFTVATTAEAQDLLDSILKIAYPYISQAKKLTGMNKEIEYSRSGAGFKFCLLPEALPVGYEDKTQVIVGVMKNKLGKRSVVKVPVWRSKESAYYEHKDTLFFKSIVSESVPVDMENAESGHPRTLTLSATGRALVWSLWLGDYILTEGEEHRGRPVYRNSTRGVMFSLEDGAWGVSNVEWNLPWMRSTIAAPSPFLCRDWKHSANLLSGGAPWKDGDITVTIKK